MIELFQAIYGRFSVEPHNDFYTAVGGRMAFARARESWSMPYAVYTLVSNVPQYEFGGGPIENARIQISLFSDSDSATEITNLYDYLTALFDDCELTISGCNHLLMERIFNQLLGGENNDYWHYIVEYRVIYE